MNFDCMLEYQNSIIMEQIIIKTILISYNLDSKNDNIWKLIKMSFLNPNKEDMSPLQRNILD